MKKIQHNSLKKYLFAVSLIIMIIGLVGCEEQAQPEKVGAKTVQNDKNENESNKINAPKIFKVGDIVQLKDYKVTVNGIRTATEDKDGFNKAESGNEFLFVDCSIQNISKETQTVSSILMFKVVDKEGREYNQEIFTDTKGQLDGDIAPTRKIKGEYAVQVPKGKKGLELVFDSSLLTGGQVIVTLR